jgi:hypothetical protein
MAPRHPNEQKAKNLHDAYPTLIPDFLWHLKNAAGYIKTHKEELKRQWQSKKLPLADWLYIADSVHLALENNQTAMEQSSEEFAKRLFREPECIMTVHCLQNYAVIARNDDFAVAVKSYFPNRPI